MGDENDAQWFKLSASLKASDLESYEKSKQTGQHRLLNFFIWVGVVVCGFFVYGIVGKLSGEPVLGFAAWGAFLLLVKLVFSAKEKERRSKVADEIVPYELTLDQLGVMQKIGRTETRYGWNEIQNVTKLPDFIEIESWDGRSFLVPKDSFDHEGQFEACFQFATDRKEFVTVGHG
ncbi:MAG: YcxB family protein [Aestuariivirga sp.]